jgi:hypothetical protein
MQIRVPSPSKSSQYAVGFVSDPGLELLVESSLWRRDNEMFRDVLNSMISRKLISMFNDLMILPNFRSFDFPLLANAIMEAENDMYQHLVSGKSDERRKMSFSKNSFLHLERSAVENSSSIVGLLTRRREHEVIDIFQSKCPPVNTELSASSLDGVQSSLIRHFLRLALEDGSNGTYRLDAWTSTAWETIKSKKHVAVQKKIVYFKDGSTTVFRGIFKVHCGAHKTFQILRNFEHFRHIEDSYVDSESIAHFHETMGFRRLRYRLGKTEKIFSILEVRSRLDQENQFIVVHRSASLKFDDLFFKRKRTSSKSSDYGLSFIPSSSHSQSLRSLPRSELSSEVGSAEFSLNSSKTYDKQAIISDKLSTTENQDIVYVYGYLISGFSNDAACTVTILSQYGDLTLHKLNVSYHRCLKLKEFIEELSGWSNFVGDRFQ